MKNDRLESLIWKLIYGGIAVAMLGLWTIGSDAALGHGLAWGGGLLVLIGAGGVWLRSRRPDDAEPPADGPAR